MLLWIGFTLFILLLLALDLGVFHRRAHAVGVREALAWSAVWVGVAMLFNVLVYYGYERHWLGLDLPDAEPDGRTAAVAFFTGYLVEKSLSADNLFVIAMVFAYFGVPAVFQHRVLFWGIVGALVLRGALILVGAVLLEHFHWVLYVFGGFLIWTAFRMLRSPGTGDAGDNVLVRAARRWFPVTIDFEGPRFLVRRNGRRLLTPLALALVAVESADLVFAVDSIPAVFAVTDDPFLVFTSNVFALLGLRSLYFALAGVLDRFYYLKYSLAAILALVGAKMLFKDVLHDVPGLVYYTLGAIVALMGFGVLASIARARRSARTSDESDLAVLTRD